MRSIPSASESPLVREAFIAGASVLDVPDSPAAWAAVILWPGRQMDPVEVLGRVPVYDSDGKTMLATSEYDDHSEDMAEYAAVAGAPVPPDRVPPHYMTRLPRYPGTIAAAEWIACEFAIAFARRLKTPGTTKFWEIRPVAERSRDFYAHDALPLRLYTTRRDIVDFLEENAPVAHAD